MKRPVRPPLAPSVTAFFALLLSSLAAGWAQPLASLAPADTVLSLGMQARHDMFGALGNDLAALDWARAGETLGTLSSFLSETTDDPDLKEALERNSKAFESLYDPTAALSAELLGELATCPAYIEATEAAQAAYKDNAYPPSDALLTVSVSAFNPVPTLVGLTRADASIAEFQEAAFSAYVSCLEASGEVERLEQDGTTLYIVGNESDFPYIIGRVGNLYFFGTNPEPLRGVVRRAEGSSEPSLADSALYKKAARLEAGESNLSLTLDFAALAEVLEGFGGMVASSPEDDYVVERGVALLRTLGGYAGVLSATPEGLLFESVTAVDPEGGDAALAKLLLCETCALGSPFLAPAEGLATHVYRLPLRDIFNYAQGLLDAAPPVLGVSVNLRDVLREALDLDIDRDLFDWLGTEGYTALLEPASPNLRTLFYGQAQVTILPIASREAAEAGVEEILRVLTLLFETAVAADDAALFFSRVSSEKVTYKGETFTRYRSSINGDIGVGFLDNYLVIGTPARALEAVIDTFKGHEKSLLETSAYQTATLATPTPILGQGYVEVGRQMGAYADLLGVFSQPLAFALSAGFKGLASENRSDVVALGYEAELTGVEATPLDVLPSPAVRTDNFILKDGEVAYHDLINLEAGDEVVVTLQGAPNTALFLVNKSESLYLMESYTKEGAAAQLAFTAEAGTDYWLEVLEVFKTDGGAGSYTLSVTRTPAGEVKVAAPPSFGDLLHLADLVPATLRVLGEHVGVSTSYTEARGDALYHHSLTRIDW